MDHDTVFRIAVFDFLDQLRMSYGQILPWHELSRGFRFRGKRAPLIGAKGIWKPEAIDFPISLATSPSSPYNDAFNDSDELLDYKYRKGDAGKSDNDKVRAAMLKNLPLVYFHGMAKGKYEASWPVFIVGDDSAAGIFKVAVDDKSQIGKGVAGDSVAESDLIRRKYVTRLTKARLHQSAFRVQVLDAYDEQCSICRLKHVSLLEAAHIVPDSDSEGEPVVSNGMALCKIHHAAFDQNILGVTPDLKTEVRLDVLDEVDGPMLKHGIQDMHGRPLHIPKSASKRPDSALIARRYEEFKAAF